MSAAEELAKKKMSKTTIISTLAIVIMLVFSVVTVILIQFDSVRTKTPHTQYEQVADWPYDIDWAGGRSSWFDNINYTDLPLDQELPEDLLEQMENVVFVAEPDAPPQLWRRSAYDAYDGSGWAKTLTGEEPISLISYDTAVSQGNEIYTVYLNITVGPNVGSIELPILFPGIQVIDGTFRTDPDDALLSYEVSTDDYDTLLVSPFLRGETGETVLLSYDVTYENQDLEAIAANALEGISAPPGIANVYSVLPFTPTQRVLDEIDPFRLVGENAYEKARTVEVYFQSQYDLILDEDRVMERPSEGQEVTDWFIERGGGLPMDFATAYCVFMRELGIPARMVTGYAVGDAVDGQRIIRVRHMMFWAEVFIPLSTGDGEWIQVVPIALPSNMGGGELPENTEESQVELLVLQPTWGFRGDTLNFSAILLANMVAISAPEDIYFYDDTDGVEMGAATIQPDMIQGIIPAANISYDIPLDASFGIHNVSATWISPTYSITNYTYFYTVGSASPLSKTTTENGPTSYFTPSETFDINLRQGLDNHIAHWNDTLHVFGVLRDADGNPIDGTTLENDQVLIYWDEDIYGSATVQSDGSYSLDIFVDATDLIRMMVGDHLVWAEYLGEYDSESGLPILLPGRSADNSTVEVRGLPEFTLNSQSIAYRGGNLTYQGTMLLQNGTAFAGETIGLILDGVLVGTSLTDASGNFLENYTIPSGYPTGFSTFQVNWTSPYSLLDGGISVTESVEIVSGATNLTIDSNPKSPDPVHLSENITIFGYLTEAISGDGIVGYTINIYWDNGTGPELIGTPTTVAGGYYEFNFTVPTDYEGTVTYYSEFISSTQQYIDAQSDNMTILVKKYDLAISISVAPNPGHVTEDITIQGVLYLPEFLPTLAVLPNEHLNIWWQNSSGVFNLTGIYTSAVDGTYSYTYNIPLNHAFETVQIWVNYSSPYVEISSNQSIVEFLPVTYFTSNMTIQTNATSNIFYLNETVWISGYLSLENGSALTSALVNVSWTNATDTYYYTVYTNGTGWYNFYYNCSVTTDSAGSITVSAIHNNLTRVYDGCSVLLSPNVSLELYQLTIDANTNATEIHQDEVLQFSGTITFDNNGAPLSGGTVVVYYKNNTGTYLFPKVTDAAGNFLFLYNYSINDALGAVYLWARYTSSNPLWDNAESLNRTVNIILYQLTITTLTNSTSYHQDEVVHVYGRLTFSHNGTPLENQPIRVYWNNGTEYYFQWYITNSTGWYNFYYNLSLNDGLGSVDIWATYNNSIGLLDNATSYPGISIDIILYSLTLTTTTDSGTYYLDEVVYVTGQLYRDGVGPVVGETVEIYWFNGTEYIIASRITNTTGYYNFTYVVSTETDDVGSVSIWATYTSTNPLWDNATSYPGVTIDLNLYSLTLTTSTDLSIYHLDESIFVVGRLTFNVNGSPISGASIRLYWNSTGTYFDGIITNSTGYFNFTYDLSPLTDSTGPLTIWATYTASNPLWENASSSPGSTVNIVLYTPIMDIFLNPNPVYLNETIEIAVRLYFSNGTGIAGELVSFYWNNGTEYLITSVSTNALGWANITYDQMDEDAVWTVTIRADFAGNDYVASVQVTDILTLQQWLTYISGFGTGGITDYYLGETIVATGNLYYDTGGSDPPYYNIIVELIFDGLVVATDVTAPDGSFSISWVIPQDTTPGTYDVYVRFNSSLNWIADSAATPISINLDAYYLIWQFDLSRNVVYRGEYIVISGNVTIDNGTAYASQAILLYWIRAGTGGQDELITSVLTQLDGTFSYSLLIEVDANLGTYEFWAGCVPSQPTITASNSSSSFADIELVPVYLTLITNSSVVYRGNTITFSGTLTFGDGISSGNGSAMVGYDVEIFLNDELVATITITNSSGYFTYSHPIAWDQDIGVNFYYGEFLQPSIAFEDEDTSDESRSFEVRDMLTVELDTQTVTIMFRGDTIDVTGIISNQQGGISDVTVELVVDGVGQQIYDITSSTGSFSVSWDVPSSATIGTYNFTISVGAIYYDIDSNSDFWEIDLHLLSQITGELSSYPDIMPGEEFVFIFGLADEDGNALVGEDVQVFLNSTSLGTWTVTSAGNNRITHTLPESWPSGNGYYVIRVVYAGSGSINGSSESGDNRMHVFVDIVFASPSPSQTAPDVPFIISGILEDSDGIPIAERTVRITLNDSITHEILTNDQGYYEYPVNEGYPEGSLYSYSVALLDAEGAVIASESFEILIQTGPGLSTALLIIWAVAIGAEVVIALLVVFRTKLFQRGTGIGKSSDTKETKKPTLER